MSGKYNIRVEVFFFKKFGIEKEKKTFARNEEVNYGRIN